MTMYDRASGLAPPTSPRCRTVSICNIYLTLSIICNINLTYFNSYIAYGRYCNGRHHTWINPRKLEAQRGESATRGGDSLAFAGSEQQQRDERIT